MIDKDAIPRILRRIVRAKPRALRCGKSQEQIDIREMMFHLMDQFLMSLSDLPRQKHSERDAPCLLFCYVYHNEYDYRIYC